MPPTYRTRVVPRDTDDGKAYDGQCACGFTTRGWPQRKLGKARIDEHTAEHETGEAAPELVDFRAAHGLNGPVGDVVDFTEEG